MKKEIIRALASAAALTLLLTGCAQTGASASPAASAQIGAEATLTAAATHDPGIDVDDRYSEWADGEYATVRLSDGASTVQGEGATVDGNYITVSAAGTYVFSGTLTNGAIIVDAGDDDDIRFVLNGANITCTDGAPIFVKNADKLIISLPDGSQNVLTDGESYTYSFFDAAEKEPSGCLFSKDDIVINGGGTLDIFANHNDGVSTNDSLKITGGTLNITSLDDGIVAKDAVSVETMALTVNAGGDAIKVTNDTDAEEGFVYIGGGTFELTAGADGIQAETELYIEGGTFKLTTGGGSAVSSKDNGWGSWGGERWNGERTGGKGMGGARPDGQTPPSGMVKPEGTSPAEMTQPEGTPPAEITQPEGTPPAQSQATAEPDTTPDATAETTATSTSAKALKAGQSIKITGGDFTIDSSDDALHTNGDMTIDGGTLAIASGDDGLHADATVTVSGGVINVSKSYEGIEGLTINITGGELSVVASDDGINVAGGADASSISGRVGQNGFDSGTGDSLNISGGSLTVDAAGDGLDSNGAISITGGEIYVSGPTNGGNGALDYTTDCLVSGGTLVIAGSVGMAQNPSESSTQYCVCGSLDAVQAAGSKLTLTDAAGAVVAEYAPVKEYQHVVFSSSAIKSGETYNVCVDGAALASVTVNGAVTTFGASAGGFGTGGGKRR